MKSNALKQLWMTIFAILLMFYFILQLSLNIGEILEIEYATYVSTAGKIELTGYIFRDEYTLNTNSSGYVKYLVVDGEKVYKGERVSTVYSLAGHAEKQQQVNEIDREIEILNQSAITAGSSTTKSEIIDVKIAQLHLGIIQAIRSNDTEKAARYEDELRIQLNRKQALVNNTENYNNYINLLEAEKSTLDSSLQNQGTVMTAKTSGYFYATVDGYEEIFSMNALQNMSFDVFDTITYSEPDQSILDNAAGKIVKSEFWSVVAELDKRSAGDFQLNKKYSIIFPYSSGETISMTLSKKISRTDNGRVLMVFTTNKIPDNFNYKRSQTIELVKETYSGLRIPLSALRVVEGGSGGDSGGNFSDAVYGVYVIAGNKLIIKKVSVLYEENGYLICKLPTDPFNPKNKAYISSEYLSLYDAVVSSGRDLYEGKVLK